MTLKRTLIVACAAAAVGAAGLAIAQPMEGHWHHGGELGAILHGLNLTDAQKQQAQAIRKSAWAQARPVMQQMHALHEQLATQFLTAGTTQADLQSLVRQEELLRNKLDADRLAAALQVRALLTPDQLAQAAATHSKLEALHAQENEVVGEGGEGHE